MNRRRFCCDITWGGILWMSQVGLYLETVKSHPGSPSCTPLIPEKPGPGDSAHMADCLRDLARVWGLHTLGSRMTRETRPPPGHPDQALRVLGNRRGTRCYTGDPSQGPERLKPASSLCATRGEARRRVRPPHLGTRAVSVSRGCHGLLSLGQTHALLSEGALGQSYSYGWQARAPSLLLG